MSLLSRWFRRGGDDQGPPGSQWYEHYQVTEQDARFMSDMLGHTLLPSSVRLPSGRTVNGVELKTWLENHTTSED